MHANTATLLSHKQAMQTCSQRKLWGQILVLVSMMSPRPVPVCLHTLLHFVEGHAVPECWHYPSKVGQVRLQFHLVLMHQAVIELAGLLLQWVESIA